MRSSALSESENNSISSQSASPSNSPIGSALSARSVSFFRLESLPDELERQQAIRRH
jgi:hypothetical protein